MSINDTIRDIIFEYLDCYRHPGIDKVADLRPEMNLIDDLGADSIDLVELLMEFEEQFDMEIDDDDAEKVLTVGDCFVYMEQRLEKRRK